MNKQRSAEVASKGNRQRHETQCKVCQHPQRDLIESEYLAWTGPLELLERFKDAFSKQSLHRHVKEFELDTKRLRNIRGGFAKLAENYRPSTKGHSDGYLFLQALQSMARTNSKGEWVERTEDVNKTELIARMTEDELRVLAETGEAPEWAKPFLLKDGNKKALPEGRIQ